MTVVPGGRQFITSAKEGVEHWKSTIEGQIWVEVTRNEKTGERVTVVVPAHGTLRITKEDRELAQDLSMTNPDVDPFTNGMLIRTDADQQADPRTQTNAALTAEDLVRIFELEQPEFEKAVEALPEVPVRRLMSLVEDADPRVAQVTYLREMIERRWPLGGDTPSNREARAQREE